MKQPAYAKRLVEQRRAGTHPEHVVVIYGNDWRVEDGVVRLAVKPGEALELNWAAVAGLPVRLVDRTRDDEDIAGADGVRELHRLFGEIAQLAATVHVTSAREGLREHELSTLAFISRVRDDNSKLRWPAWWSDDIERIHGQNTERWLSEIAQALCA